ncbi:MAG: hypothetical protein K9J12_14625 [Melioribacteraceae bacterium]|nr:hypothetical protein [Melioribacteraceae bacterium]MCF8265940.1 hypothetical protein [Melioribacteraceae bacterium]
MFRYISECKDAKSPSTEERGYLKRKMPRLSSIFIVPKAGLEPARHH